jgi:hypothetical protein
MTPLLLAEHPQLPTELARQQGHVAPILRTRADFRRAAIDRILPIDVDAVEAAAMRVEEQRHAGNADQSALSS